MLHAQWRVSYDERLLLCPKERFRGVLDIGTGTGIWAIEFADEDPHLEPGGYFEVKDILLTPKCDDGTLEEMLVEAGFTRVDDVEQKWPTKGWAEGPQLRELGLWSQFTFGRELETISKALLIHGLGWHPEKVSVLCALVRKEFKNL
ncbi:hypothetical protein N657DRAFT_659694 [Parathielavia appendiculata]|uniref:Uncharacterized protein n=1 Tax=Parathielavia appendiculata TaxID=2587402 RepID=A0AAN6TPH6_9PEZI|nr:hypothetical protein N657DRAFT_659694 [Parathielavia appendiculata]